MAALPKNAIARIVKRDIMPLAESCLNSLQGAGQFTAERLEIDIAAKILALPRAVLQHHEWAAALAQLAVGQLKKVHRQKVPDQITLPFLQTELVSLTDGTLVFLAEADGPQADIWLDNKVKEEIAIGEQVRKARRFVNAIAPELARNPSATVEDAARKVGLI